MYGKVTLENWRNILLLPTVYIYYAYPLFVQGNSDGNECKKKNILLKDV